MSATASFDIVSEFDYQELVNAVDQTRREMNTRFDLKDTKSEVELGETAITLHSNSEFTLDAVRTILQTKTAKRNLSLKIFDYGKIESATGNRVRQEITLKKGIETELAKKIMKAIRDEFKKIQVSIQGDSLRITSKSKDELQQVIQFVKQGDWPIALQFTNYRWLSLNYSDDWLLWHFRTKTVILVCYRDARLKMPLISAFQGIYLLS